MNSPAWLITSGVVVLAASFSAASLKAGEATLGSPDLRGVPRANTIAPACESPLPPQRVVSAALLADELLLGVLPFERWVLVSYAVDWPASTPVHASFPKRLVRTQGSVEQILQHRPDLVVLSDYNSAAVAAQLTEAGVCVRRIPSAQSFERLFQAWLELGRWVGAAERAQALVADAEARLARLRRRPRSGPRRVLLLQDMFSYGSGTLQAECLRLAGFQNVVADPRWGATPQLNVEHVLSLSPDTIFVATDVSEPRPATPNELPAGVPWHAVAAAQRGQVYSVPAAWMASISHHALLACEAYARFGAGLS